MTTRTLSLFLLFVIALGVSAVLVAAAQPMAIRFDESTPLIVPVVAMVCYSVTLFAGRRYILPNRMTQSPAQAFATLVAITAASMGLAYGVLRLAHRLVDSIPAVVALGVWFMMLWTAVAAIDRPGRSVDRLRS